MPIESLVRVVALPLPSFVEEIGFMFEDSVGNEMWVRETDPEFRWLASSIEADQLFGDNWYRRAESGERISAQLPNTPA